MKLLPFKVAFLCVILFSACKKNDYNYPKNDFPDSGEAANVFYALGETNKLDKYGISNPYRMMASATITGLQPAERILAIDFRPATGQLYGLGSTSRLYVINPMTGLARTIGTAPFTTPLSGTIAGFDFNPTVDRIRVVTSTGQNLRLNPETGGVAFVDLSINGVDNAMVTSVAYTNNVSGAATTVLYDIDVTSDKLYKQNPPNDGKLELVGSLNVNLEGEGGFDIAPPALSGKSGNAAKFFDKPDLSALAIYKYKQKTSLFAIDLTTGNAKEIYGFDKKNIYYGIAIPTQPVAYAVSGGNFLTFNPNNTTTIVSKPLTGLAVGETVVGLDFRPANGQLYALGSNSRLYTVNASSGLATFVAPLSVALNGTSFGLDFNPVVDRIRIVSNLGQNLRVNPADGVALVDGSLNPGTPAVSAAAYTNNFAGTTATVLYVIDAGNDKLYIQNPPNAGTLTEVGNLGVDIDASNGFDIGGTSNKAYAVLTSGGTTKIYSATLTDGKVKMNGSLPSIVSGFTIGLGF